MKRITNCEVIMITHERTRMDSLRECEMTHKDSLGEYEVVVGTHERTRNGSLVDCEVVVRTHEMTRQDSLEDCEMTNKDSLSDCEVVVIVRTHEKTRKDSIGDDEGLWRYNGHFAKTPYGCPYDVTNAAAMWVTMEIGKNGENDIPYPQANGGVNTCIERRIPSRLIARVMIQDLEGTQSGEETSKNMKKTLKRALLDYRYSSFGGIHKSPSQLHVSPELSNEISDIKDTVENLIPRQTRSEFYYNKHSSRPNKELNETQTTMAHHINDFISGKEVKNTQHRDHNYVVETEKAHKLHRNRRRLKAR
ncbi:hypothetical protein DPMN_156022 [Dreissena polymorpha]|uniref:Uncharacterized protein n=1 Tax=Dreissena polymorpha TaxID=45954 RepID=A0A9D4FST3_DREPO|nr:hypothetical protein DPMN_156022 [Dreissena polymorpha]